MNTKIDKQKKMKRAYYKIMEPGRRKKRFKRTRTTDRVVSGHNE
jgi:hypothetical protein